MLNSLCNFDYDICLAKSSFWTLDEATDYLASYLANKEKYEHRETAYNEFINIREQLLSAVLQSIREGRLFIVEEYDNSCCDGDVTDINRSTVTPYIFIDWAMQNNIDVPTSFARYVKRRKGDKAGNYEVLGAKKTTIHHERCRAIAELIWSIEPEIPIAVMARRDEIIKFGCEEHFYDTRTICRWLSNLKNERRQGQPRKQIVASCKDLDVSLSRMVKSA